VSSTTPHVRGMNSVERLYENGESDDGERRGAVLAAPQAQHGDAEQGGAHARGGDAVSQPGEPHLQHNRSDEPRHGVPDVERRAGCGGHPRLGAGVPAQRVPAHAGREEVAC